MKNRVKKYFEEQRRQQEPTGRQYFFIERTPERGTTMKLPKASQAFIVSIAVVFGGRIGGLYNALLDFFAFMAN